MPGAPVRVFIRDEDDGLDETKARGEAEKKAKPLLDKYKVGEPGSYIAGQPSMDLDDIGIYHQDSKPLAKSLDVPLPGLHIAACLPRQCRHHGIKRDNYT